MRVKPNFRGPYTKPFPSRACLRSVVRGYFAYALPGHGKAPGGFPVHVAVVANPPPSKSENPAQLGSHQELATDTVSISIVGLTSYPNIPILRSHVYPRSQGTADSAHADFWIAGIGHSGKFPERGLPRTNPKVGSQVSHCAAACSESGNKKPGCETQSQR